MDPSAGTARRRRVLFVNMFFDPSIAATVQMLSDLARELHARGWSVEIVCSNRLYEDASARLPATYNPAGVAVRRLPLLFFSRSGPFRALGYLEFLARALLHAVTRSRPDVCVTMTTPPFLLLVGAILRLRGSRHLHWSLDLYPEVARAFGALGRIGASAFACLRGVAWHLCDRVVALGPVMGQRILRAGLAARKLRIVPVWARAEEIRPSLAPRGRFVLLYSGNMGRSHEFETAIRAARELAEVDFVFVGTGARRSEVERAATDLPNVTLRPPLPRGALSGLFASASAQLVTLDPRADGLLVPSKMFGAMASGRPIVLVASARNDLARELEEGRFGFRVEPGDVPGFVRVVRILASDPGLAREMGERARSAFLERYDLSVCAQAFAGALEGLRPSEG